MRGPSVMWALYMFQIVPAFGPVRSTTVLLEFKRKETGTKTVAIATSNDVPSDVFYVVKYTCQVPTALPHSFQRYS